MISKIGNGDGTVTVTGENKKINCIYYDEKKHVFLKNFEHAKFLSKIKQDNKN